MKKTKRGFLSTLVGLSISFINAVIQFLLIYWVLQLYGTEFNGFVRLASAFSIVGGTTEGALGISTVIFLIKPIANRDFITANEIFSTAKTRYRRGIIIKTVLTVLIAVLYPLELMIGPSILNGTGKPVLEMVLSSGMVIPVYQLMIIVLFFGIKNIITSGVFGAYENVIQADQQNGIRRVIILFSDVLIYGIIFALLNVKITTTDGSSIPLNPLAPFSILLLYSLIRGALIMLYVKRNYSWIKYYKEFNNFRLRKTTGKMFWSSIGQAVLFNSDIVIVMLVLGAYGLQTSSMLSLYLIVGLNTRLIMTNFITSFREYFVSVMVREGRLEWKSYSNYELYLYVVAAFTFIIMALISPYLVNGLYGNLVEENLAKVSSTDINFNINALYNVKNFMFQKPLFSILYGLTTAFILIIQGQYTLVQAKGKVELISKWIDIIAGVFLVVAAAMMLIFVLPPHKGDYFLVYSLVTYYIVKVIFMFITVVFLWFFNWARGTYNSSAKYVFSNLMVFLIPMTLAILASLFILEPNFPVTHKVGEDTVATFNSWQSLILYLVITIGAALLVVGITALSIRPKIAISLILMLPVIRQIVDNSKKASRYKRLRDENIDLSYYDKEEDLNYAFISVSSQTSMEFSINTVINVDDIFKPKIYKIKNKKEESE